MNSIKNEKDICRNIVNFITDRFPEEVEDYMRDFDEYITVNELDLVELKDLCCWLCLDVNKFPDFFDYFIKEAI